MQSNQTSHGKFVLTTPAVLALFGVESNPNPDDPDRPGPWGPVVRRAEERVRAALDPSSQPRREIFGPSTDPWRAAFARALAEEVIDRAHLMQQVADALNQNANAHAIIIIGGILRDFVDGCGTGRIKQHFPPPRHHDDARLSPSQIVLITAQFQANANETTNENVRQEFLQTNERLLKTGLDRLQTATAQAAG